MNGRVSAAAGSENIAGWLLAAVGLGLMGWVLSGDVRIAGGPGVGLTEIAVFALGLFNVFAAALRARWVAPLLLLQCSMAVTLVVAEIALSMTLSYRYYAPYKLDNRYLYDLVPGARREHRTLPVNGGANIYQVNSLGFRGEEFAVERSAAPRVMIYGDSFIHAEFTALEKTLAMQLQDRLSTASGLPVEVINAGVAGYGPDQASRRIEDELPKFKPDVLVLAVFTGNDYGDLVRNKIYRLGPDGSLLETNYSFSDEIKLHARLDEVEFILKRIVREAAFAVFAMLKGEEAPRFDPEGKIEFSLKQHLDEYQDFVIDQNDVIKELRSDPYSADISLLPDSPSAQYKIGLMRGVIRSVGETAARAGVPLLVVGIPHPMDVLDGAHSSGAVDMERYPAYDAERLTGTLQSIAGQQGIPYLNLLPHFREVADPASLYLQAGDDHWNDAGQSYAADIIARHIQSEGWLTSPEATATSD